MLIKKLLLVLSNVVCKMNRYENIKNNNEIKGIKIQRQNLEIFLHIVMMIRTQKETKMMNL